MMTSTDRNDHFDVEALSVDAEGDAAAAITPPPSSSNEVSDDEQNQISTNNNHKRGYDPQQDQPREDREQQQHPPATQENGIKKKKWRRGNNDNNKKGKKKKEKKPMASISETLGFVFGYKEKKIGLLFFVGCIAGILNGLVLPALAYFFSSSFTGLATTAQTSSTTQIDTIALIFVYLGLYSLVTALIQTWSFEYITYHATHNFQLKWFDALLKQDTAFFDVYDISGIAGQIGTNANKFRRGMGRKFGDGIQFMSTGVGGIAYSLYSDWRVSLVVIAAIPFVSMAGYCLMHLNQQKTNKASHSYRRASNVSYAAVSSIKTLLSLNGVTNFISMYKDATLEAYRGALSFLLKQGLANGFILGAMLILYSILTLYGTYFLYTDVSNLGCDPSGSIPNNVTCPSSGQGVFGAMMGVAFAAQAISQVGNFFESLGETRAAVYQALIAINRKPGSPQQIIYNEKLSSKKKDKKKHTAPSNRSMESSRFSSAFVSRECSSYDVESGKVGISEKADQEKKVVRAILPQFDIDPSSKKGLRTPITGEILFDNVYFAYPSRPAVSVLQGLSLRIEAGKTVAFVGPSGGGKSTVVSMLERFYDPNSGDIYLDGINLKDINLSHLRNSIGYVGQEPTLFATTIRGNIQYGNPHATQAQIEEAARLANAHDFILAFPNGYDTQVGDKGSQLSGGQKQRIAIARILVSHPKILLLDEATSALDAESELVVQAALDHIVEKTHLTTIIVAHRLSTIRHADKIYVVAGGQIKEEGSHDSLMSHKTYYRKLVEKQEGFDSDEESQPHSNSPSRSGSAVNLPALALDESNALVPHIEFKNVTFNYPSRPQKRILHGFNLSIYQGQTVALVGPSGGGKSTVTGLIERFYDPDIGEIFYRGNGLRSLNVGWYRSQIGYVGQEPTLFELSIAENIALGCESLVTRADIEEAARQANAHDFILQFPKGYETMIGSRGSQLSGGQKQRIAIARALVRKPHVLILDEATSALDNESEALVQEAIQKLMESEDHTVIVIAHRLSTIRSAHRIAVISDGKVVEVGSHEELVEKPNGRYKRLIESSKRRSTIESVGLHRNMLPISKINEDGAEQEEFIDWEAEVKEKELNAFNVKRARQMAWPDIKYILIGSIGALIAGGTFPSWGVLLSEMINLLFYPVDKCPQPENGSIPGNYTTCEDYWDAVSDHMRSDSFRVASYWAILFVASMLGNVVTFMGFGTASERLNKRVRDSSFEALLRQEVGYFDKRSVGSITSQLQDDAAQIHSFSGEPIRTFILAVSSVIIGMVIALTSMWQFALVAIGCLPIMAYTGKIKMKRMHGEDFGDDNQSVDELDSPGGILVETLSNMKTVSALCLEAQRYADFDDALAKSEPRYRIEAFLSGLMYGTSSLLQQWTFALLLWFGGWVLARFPHYTFSDYLIAQFSMMFGIRGISTASQDMSDRKQVEESAGRIFYLLDRKSEIDPLSDEGKKLN